MATIIAGSNLTDLARASAAERAADSEALWRPWAALMQKRDADTRQFQVTAPYQMATKGQLIAERLGNRGYGIDEERLRLDDALRRAELGERTRQFDVGRTVSPVDEFRQTGAMSLEELRRKETDAQRKLYDLAVTKQKADEVAGLRDYRLNLFDVATGSVGPTELDFGIVEAKNKANEEDAKTATSNLQFRNLRGAKLDAVGNQMALESGGRYRYVGGGGFMPTRIEVPASTGGGNRLDAFANMMSDPKYGPIFEVGPTPAIPPALAPAAPGAPSRGGPPFGGGFRRPGIDPTPALPPLPAPPVVPASPFMDPSTIINPILEEQARAGGVLPRQLTPQEEAVLLRNNYQLGPNGWAFVPPGRRGRAPRVVAPEEPLPPYDPSTPLGKFLRFTNPGLYPSALTPEGNTVSAVR